MHAAVKRFTFLDAGLIVALLGGAAFFLPFMQSREPDTIVVYKDNTLIARYPLSADRDFDVRGAFGPMKIRIERGGVRVLSSTCPQQVCVRTQPIKKTSQQVICEPNHVVLEIESLQKDSLDAISR
jgi:hypothetical protein